MVVAVVVMVVVIVVFVVLVITVVGVSVVVKSSLRGRCCRLCRRCRGRRGHPRPRPRIGCCAGFSAVVHCLWMFGVCFCPPPVVCHQWSLLVIS